MLTQKQLKIFQIFARQPFAKLERKQIKQQAREKSNNALSLALKQFSKENLIKIDKVGRSLLYSLNHDNNLTYNYIELSNSYNISSIEKTIKIIKEEIEKVTLFYSLVIFGSYAAQEQKKTSDLDIAVIIENKDKKKYLEAALNIAKQKSLITIDSHIITKSELLEMLIDEEENLGKQIARKHLTITDSIIFYRIIKEGMKHGFNI